MSPPPTHHLTPAALALIAALLMPAPAQASGTYPPAPPRLRSDVVRDIDPEAYNLGKSIFTGRANLTAMVPAEAPQTIRIRQQLEEIITRIPERARAQIDVPTLARVLDATSAEALVYYLKLRFRVAENLE